MRLARRLAAYGRPCGAYQRVRTRAPKTPYQGLLGTRSTVAVVKNRATNRATSNGMRPLQLWLPRLSGSLAHPQVRGDRERAYREWRGEQIIWLLPGLDEPVRCFDRELGAEVLAVPAEQLERLDVYHVGENGYVWGPGSRTRFPDGRVDGLLDVFLNVERSGGISVAPGSAEVELQVPVIEGGEIRYEGRRHTFNPGPIIPIARIDDETRTAIVRWPPERTDPPTVSPEDESLRRYGALHRLEPDGGPVVIPQQNPDIRALPLQVIWPGDLAGLFAAASGPDDLHEKAVMVDLATNNGNRQGGTLASVRAAADRYVGEGETTRWHSWFWPTFAEEGESGILFAIGTRYEVEVSSLGDALQSEVLRRKLSQNVPIRRAWGAAGLLWALLLEQLEGNRGFLTCERCGRIIQGRSHKRFCDKTDDENCYQRRRADGQQRRRQETRSR